MNNGLEIIQNKKRKEECDRIKKCFEGSYDFSKQADQIKMVEAMVEIGKIVALTGKNASVSFTFGADGVTGIIVNNVPKQAPADINDT